MLLVIFTPERDIIDIPSVLSLSSELRIVNPLTSTSFAVIWMVISRVAPSMIVDALFSPRSLMDLSMVRFPW